MWPNTIMRVFQRIFKRILLDKLSLLVFNAAACSLVVFPFVHEEDHIVIKSILCSGFALALLKQSGAHMKGTAFCFTALSTSRRALGPAARRLFLTKRFSGEDTALSPMQDKVTLFYLE